MQCIRCLGRGIVYTRVVNDVPVRAHPDNGICWRCKGTGVDPGIPSVAEERFDKAVLRGLVLKLAVRVKSSKPWPEQPFLCEMEGFKVWVGMTLKEGFRKVVITFPEAPSMRVVLIDANPEKAWNAGNKVMVYAKHGPGNERVGQVRLGGTRPVLVWFTGERRSAPGGDPADAVDAAGVAH